MRIGVIHDPTCAYFSGIASFSLHGWLWGLAALFGTYGIPAQRAIVYVVPTAASGRSGSRGDIEGVLVHG
jgi:hypothetical protein